MRLFNIEAISEKSEMVEGIWWHEGKITIGDYSEIFDMPLNMWTVEDYIRQWKEGIERIKTHDTSCLVTSIRMLETGLPCMVLWKLYKVGQDIFMTYQLLGGEVFERVKGGPKPYYLATCYQLIDERITNQEGKSIDEDGNVIAEWKMSVDDFFASTLP